MSEEIKDLAGNVFVPTRVSDNTSEPKPAERSLIDKLNAFQNTLSGGESDLVEQAAERIAMLEEQLAASDQELETICKTLDVCERLIVNRDEEFKALKEKLNGR